jgi:hypothetical protein
VRVENREESLMMKRVYSFSSFIFLGGVFMGELTGVKRQPPQKTRRGKISSLFVRRARSLLESALIGREEHDDAVVKVVGEEEEEVEQKVRVRRRAERINNNNNKNKHVVARDD